jgi:hypothetical protein
VIRDDHDRHARDGIGVLQTEQRRAVRQKPIGNHHMNATGQRISLVVAPLLVGVGQPRAERDERIGPGTIDLASEAETDGRERSGILSGKE